MSMAPLWILSISFTDFLALPDKYRPAILF
jgi:hypothetical protein